MGKSNKSCNQKNTMFCMKVDKNTRDTRWYSKYWNSDRTNFVPLCAKFFNLKTQSTKHKKKTSTGNHDIGQKLQLARKRLQNQY